MEHLVMQNLATHPDVDKVGFTGSTEVMEGGRRRALISSSVLSDSIHCIASVHGKPGLKLTILSPSPPFRLSLGWSDPA